MAVPSTLLHSKSTYFGTSVPQRASTIRTVAASRNLSLSIRNDNVLIVNTKGGGHAFIGLYLAKELASKGHSVTIMNDGDPAKLTTKSPFKEYQRLSQMGVKITFADPTNPRTYPSGDFHVVYDNNGKDIDNCKPLIDASKGLKNLKHYVYVSSAGAYLPSNMEPCHFEGDLRKSSAGHVAVENYLQMSGLPYTVFQPLYIYGPYNGKDCEQWFLDRIMRNRPVPIPKPGVQLTSLSHVEDVSSMLALVIGNRRAIGQHYNVCGDRCVSFTGIVKILAAAAGKEPEIVYYDPKALKLKKGEGFPFRTVHFFASDVKARMDLGYTPNHSLKGDAKALVAEYVNSGRANKQIDLSVDDRILDSVKPKAYAW